MFFSFFHYSLYNATVNFVVLSSSRGTTFQAVIEAMQKGALTAKCLGLVTDSADKACIDKAKAAGLPFKIVPKVKGESREDFDRRVHDAVVSLGVEKNTVIAALGWMFIFSSWFIQTWKDRIINVHPALLPKHGGKGMYGHHVHAAVLLAQEKESGVTIHLMDEGVDTGRILLQKTCPVLPGDTPDTLQKRVQELEKEWYPKVLQMVETGEILLPSRLSP
ncbi:MAG TPA: phosphoribosylglycinamide formyltransferase [Candidatus Peribacter riflensis]|nr:phosphoribosylglycinamide formyltransferase [Candidatus Peribacter riflensis]HBU10135.1 phosphoribosylglycinamide formyltransferase [Candidatus Peribacter riflensis]